MAETTDSSSEAGRALTPRAVSTVWVLMVGIDLLFNAGILSFLFEQAREPALLPDDALFRRIPVAYLALLMAVSALAWVLDRAAIGTVRAGALVGGVGGLVAAATGIVSLWTAVDMTMPFVAGGAVVQVVEFASAGTALAAYRSAPQPGRVVRITFIAAAGCAVAGIIIQNLM